MNRRGFIGGIGASFVGIAVPSIGALAMPDIPTAQVTFSEMVANTLRVNRAEITASVLRNNALLAKLNRNSSAFAGGIEIPG